MKDDLPPVVTESFADLWAERRTVRRERAIETNVCERLRKSWEKPSKVGEANKLTKYTTRQCTEARACLAANKRVKGRGLSWIMIGRMTDLPYQTVRKLNQKTLSTGRRYRPDAEPTEEEINHFVQMIQQKEREDHQLKLDRDKVARDVYWALHNSAKSQAESVQAQRDTGEISWLTDQCVAISIRVPRTHNDLSEAISRLVQVDGIDMLRLSTAMQQLAALFDNPKTTPK